MMPALQATHSIHCDRALVIWKFLYKVEYPIQKLDRTAGNQPQWLKCWLRRSCSNHTWIWSIFTHVVSGYVNLPEQKKVFTQERSSILSGWDTYMEGVMSCENGLSPGAPLTYFNDGGSEGFFWVWHFGEKGFFWVYERRRNFFWIAKKTQGFFWLLYFSSAQINNNISTIYCLCGITGYFWDCNLFEK